MAHNAPEITANSGNWAESASSELRGALAMEVIQGICELIQLAEQKESCAPQPGL